MRFVSVQNFGWRHFIACESGFFELPKDYLFGCFENVGAEIGVIGDNRLTGKKEAFRILTV